MDKQLVGQLPDITEVASDDELMVITDSEHNQLRKLKVSDFLSNSTSQDANNALQEGSDGKLYVPNFGDASNITEGTLPIDVIPDIPYSKLPNSGVTADTYEYPTEVTVNEQGIITSITSGAAGGNNANQDLSNLSEEGEQHFLNKSQITNCILSNAGSSITPTDYTQQAYVNKDCTISETNVVSGFSATSYIILNKTFTNSSSFTFTIPFTLTATTGVQPIVAINDTANSLAVANGVLRFNYMGETLTGTTTLAASTAYTVQFIRTDNGYTVQLKAAADEDYTQEINLPSSLDYFSGKTVYLGSDRINALNGTIDLANTSITADSATFWDINTLLNFQTVTLSGSLDTLMPNGRKEDLTLNNLEQTVTLDTTLLLNNATSNTKTILVKDNNEVMIRDSYTESSDEPSDSVSGAIWLDTDTNQMKEQQVVLPNLLNSGCSFYDGVASNFSQAGYLSLPSEYNLGSDWSISLPVNIQKNADSDMNVILGDLTEEGSSVIPDSVAVVYDGDETVTAYLRREDVYGATKQVVTSTAYTVTKGEAIGYVSVEGSSGTYVPAETQVYSDSIMSAPYEVAAANTWTYTGDSVENTATQNGYVRESGSVFVASGVQVYTTADLTTPLETASGSDWVYTGATSPSMIGALNETVAPQNYTVVGSPTINNGVVSGFSTGSCISVTDIFSPGSQTWEKVTKITTGSDVNTAQNIFGNNKDYGGAALNIYQNDLCAYISSNGTSWNIASEVHSTNTLAANTTYYIKYYFTGSQYKADVSTTGEFSGEEVNYITIESTTPIFAANTETLLGSSRTISGITGPFLGSIDLNDSYIKINGETFWSYQSGDTTLNLSYNGTQYALGSQTLASTDAVKSGWRPTIGSAPSTANAYFNSTIDIGNADISFWTWNGISDIKPNYDDFVTLYGDLNLSNGILSGFSASNYAITVQEFNPGTQPWEIVMKIITGNDVAASQRIIETMRGFSTGSLYSPVRLAISASKIYANLSANLTSDSIGIINGTTTLSTNTAYYAKLQFTGSQYILSLSTDGKIYNTEGTLTSSANILDGYPLLLGRHVNTASASISPLKGSVDLNSSYININGQTWWKWNGVTGQGYSWQTFPAAKIGEVAMKSEIVEPNYTVVGSPTITEAGVVSGFATGNYVQLPQEFNPDGQTWEAVYDFVTGSNVSTNQAIMSNPRAHSGIILHIFESKINYYASSDGSTMDITDGSYVAGTSTLSANTHYYIKLAFTGTQYIVYLSTTGKFNGEETTEITITSSESLYPGTMCFGIGSSGGTTAAYPFLGTINLSECYITLGGQIFYRWNGYVEPITVYSVDTATINYPVELVKKEDLRKDLAEQAAWAGGIDFSKGITPAINNTFTPPTDGWIHLDLNTRAQLTYTYLYLGTSATGSTIGGYSNEANSGYSCAQYIRLNKGETYYIYSNNASNTRVTFYPCKGVAND